MLHQRLPCRVVGVWGCLALAALLFAACDSKPAGPPAGGPGAAKGPTQPPQTPAATPQAGPRYFTRPQEIPEIVTRLIVAKDWATLASYYNLSLTRTDPADLLSGKFFIDESASPTQGPTAVSRYKRPFPPGAKYVWCEPVGDETQIPCIWNLHTLLEIDEGGGMMRRGEFDTRILQTKEGLQLLPPAPIEDGPKPAAGPKADPTPVPDVEWNAKGADPVLFYKPELRERAAREIPAGGARNIPALVAAIEKLRPLAAAKPGGSRTGSMPWEPAVMYEPSDEELLLSLAGDRVWRTTQIAPPGLLDELRKNNPEFKVSSFDYPHIEITKVDVAGTGPKFYAAKPEVRHVTLGAP